MLRESRRSDTPAHMPLPEALAACLPVGDACPASRSRMHCGAPVLGHVAHGALVAARLLAEVGTIVDVATCSNPAGSLCAVRGGGHQRYIALQHADPDRDQDLPACWQACCFSRCQRAGAWTHMVQAVSVSMMIRSSISCSGPSARRGHGQRDGQRVCRASCHACARTHPQSTQIMSLGAAAAPVSSFLPKKKAWACTLVRLRVASMTAGCTQQA